MYPLSRHGYLGREGRVGGVIYEAAHVEASLCWRWQVEAEDEEFEEEFVGTVAPSILHFLLASGDRISSKQLRDDLMTMLIAGHETTAAVLTWTMYCLSQHPDVVLRLQQEVRLCLNMLPPGSVSSTRQAVFTCIKTTLAAICAVGKHPYLCQAM